jgi:hypothetical protein
LKNYWLPKFLFELKQKISMSNKLNITLEDIYNQSTTSFYLIILDILLVINIAWVCPAIYIVIWKANKEIGVIRWYFCLNFITGLLVDLIIGIFKPVPLFPFYIGYLAGPAKLLGFADGFSIWEGGISIFDLMVVLLTLQFIYRFTFVLPWGSFYEVFEKLSHVLIIGFVLYVLMLCLTTQILYRNRVGIDALR